MDERRRDQLRKLFGLLQDEQGKVGREISGAVLLLPAQVETAGGFLRYLPAGFLRMQDTGEIAAPENPKSKTTVLGALDEFVQLTFPSETERLSSSDVADFVKRWGGLWLCEHGLPHTHQPVHSILIDPTGNLTRCLPRMVDGMFAEPVDHWRALATSAFNILQIAARVRRTGGARTDQKWRRILIKLVNTWLTEGSVTIQLSDVAPQYKWPGGVEFRLRVGSSLYAILAAQLAMAVTLSRQFYICAECGKLFNPDPSHRPRVGRRVFCLECGRPAAVRQAMAAMRERRRQEENAGSEKDRAHPGRKRRP